MSAAAPPPATGRPSGGRTRAVGFACAAIGCVGLPALVAGLDIDAPAASGELERLRAAWAGTSGTELGRQFEVATLPATAEWPTAAGKQHGLLAMARLMQVLAMFAVSALCYFVVVLARGRLPALVTTAGLVLLPAVYEHGHVLRPETAAVTFALLGLLLLQLTAHAVHQRRRRGRLRRVVVLLGLLTTASFAMGLALGTRPTMGGILLVPIALFMLATLQTALRGLRIGRRRGFLAWPAHAITQRLWPIATVALLAPLAGALCMVGSLKVPADRVTGSELAARALPESPLGAWTLLALAGLGAITFVVRTGVRFGRRGRLGPDLVLLAYAGTQILYVTNVDGRFDPLPAAPALAVLIGEGLFGIVALLAWLNARR